MSASASSRRTPPHTARHSTLLLASLLLIAMNFRGPITGVGPVLAELQAAFSLSPATAGLLTTLPLLAFGVVSPFAASFAQRFGLERALFASLVLVACGVLLRSAGPVGSLFAGTAIIGIGIAIGNVLLPSLVKRDFPARVPGITATCALMMGIAAGVVSAAAVPLAGAVGWQLALGASVLLPLLACLAWSAQLSSRTAPASGTADMPHGGPVWRSPLAWQVTLFIGTNSLLFYVLIAWLPTILTEAGLSPTMAGSLHGAMQLAAAVPGLFLGPMIGRMKDQKAIAAVLSLLVGVGLVGFIVRPGFAMLWATCVGFASGGAFILALIYMGLRTRSPQQAAALSGMAQCVGYLLAAGGPTLAGLLHDRVGSWTAVLAAGVLLSGVMAVCGVLAGRPRTVGGG
jgi:CP family cyanate transporter-like MFS transporter